MNVLEEWDTSCPYCGESITLLVDRSQPDQSYVEDCEVCCRPISVHVSSDEDGKLSVSVQSENE